MKHADGKSDGQNDMAIIHIILLNISRMSLWKHFKFLDRTTSTINWRTNYVRIKLFIHFIGNLLEYSSIFHLARRKIEIHIEWSLGKYKERVCCLRAWVMGNDECASVKCFEAMEDWIIIWMGNWCLSYGNRRCRKNTINHLKTPRIDLV